MLKSSFTVLKGASAVGKGTRVCQLLMFLIDSKENGGLGLDYDYKFDDISYLNNKTNKIEVLKDFNTGIYIQEFNMFFVSNWVKSGKSKLISLQGADKINTYGYSAFLSLIKLMNNCNIISEGYANISSLANSCSIEEINSLGITNVLLLAYLYDSGATKDDLVNRCIERSGINKVCKGDSAWGKNIVVERSLDRQEQFLSENNDKYNNFTHKSVVKKMSHNSLVNSFGEEYLKFIGLDNLIEKFLYYSKTLPTLRHYSKLDENYSKFLKYYEENKRIIREHKNA